MFLLPPFSLTLNFIISLFFYSFFHFIPFLFNNNSIIYLPIRLPLSFSLRPLFTSPPKHPHSPRTGRAAGRHRLTGVGAEGHRTHHERRSRRPIQEARQTLGTRR